MASRDRAAPVAARRQGCPQDRARRLAIRLARARLIYLRRRELRWDWLALVLCLAVCRPEAASAQPPDLPEGIGAGSLYLHADRQALVGAPRLATRVRIEVSGPLAQVELEQRFRNEGTDWVEAVYVFPLPEAAAVQRLELVIGERRIVGDIREREEARRSYERARADGRRTSLLEQRRPNLFTTSVANVGPGEEIVVELAYLQTLDYRDGGYSLRFPMTLTPRYEPGSRDAGEAPRGSAPPMAAQAATGHRLQLSARLEAGFALARLESRSHAIDTWWEGNGFELRLRDGEVPLDRDFELAWAPELGALAEARVFTERAGGETYALVSVVPPAPQASPARHDREVVFVIDTSGSMAGPSIEQAREALVHALDRLAPQDRFNVIQFNSITERLFPTAVPAEAAHVRAAREYVAALRANGGTEMRGALLAGLADAEGSGVRQLVFVTDGSVGNEPALFRLIHERLGRTRLFTVGIGAAPNTWFMRKAAQFGRGSYTYIGDASEVAARIRGLFEKLERPVLTDLELHWPGEGAAERFPQRLPDLYSGEPLLVTVRFADVPRRIEIAGEGLGGPWLRQLELEPAGAARGVATLWARAKIEELADREIEGADPRQVRAETVAVALRHRIVSRYTSFVAVEQTASRPFGATLANRAVPNSLPHGSTLVSLPATATAARLHTLIGLVLLVLATLWGSRRAWGL